MISGVKIKFIPKESSFFRAGLRSGDFVTHINGEPITDELDFRFFAAVDLLDLSLRRDTRNLSIRVERDEGSFLDVDLYENPINCCKNRCIFCFIDQMPPGLRSGLYIKDEDFKHSFFNGNYVTLSSATKKDLERVAKLGISPLYISVHATDTAVRNKMLRNSKAPAIMSQLEFLRDSGVSFHTQIVVCKGYNDGEILMKTIDDLFSFRELLLSIAVVPVGLTRFRKFPLNPVDMNCAQWICGEVEKISTQHAARDGIRKLFLADEFFIKANISIPQRKYYEDYPQIENGIGLVRQLLEEWKSCKRKLKSGKLHIDKNQKSLAVTSVSAYPFLESIIGDAKTQYPEFNMDLTAAANHYFGETVTVAGLLTAKDVIGAIKKESKLKQYKQIFLPSVMFNYEGYTLDGFSLDRIKKTTGLNIRIAESLYDLFNGK